MPSLSEPSHSGPSSASDVSSKDSLPPSALDGSHLHWKQFRRDVLAPHNIIIQELSPNLQLPKSLLSLIEFNNKNLDRWSKQKSNFRDQVSKGRGFGPSSLFPPNLLPSIDDEGRLARCMVPLFSREALPERLHNYKCPYYELQIPRAGLGCGFSASAFTPQELHCLPSWLITTGTIVHFETGYISPGAHLYCPFLTFERTHGQQESRLEASTNQCAIAGAWSVRSLQMLYANSYGSNDPRKPASPVTFTCTIDNDFAIVNYHWINDPQLYCMSPLCKFDLSKEEHFSQFLVWIESIGQWGVNILLPTVKASLEVLKNQSPSPPASPAPTVKVKTKNVVDEERLVKALKTTFDKISWRFDDNEFTPVSSSTASWGSPIINDLVFSQLSYPTVPPLKSRSADSGYCPSNAGTTPPVQQSPQPIYRAPSPPATSCDTTPQATALPEIAAIIKKRASMPPALFIPPGAAAPGQQTPPPAYAHNAELVTQKRLNHAMDEIRDLQAQLQVLKQEMSGSTMCFQSELSGLKNIMTNMMNKVPVQPTSPLRGMGSGRISISTNMVQMRKKEAIMPQLDTIISQSSEMTVLTSPTEPNPTPLLRNRPFRRPSGLQRVMNAEPDDDTPVEQVVERPLQSPKVGTSAQTPAIPSPAFSIFSNGENVVVVPPPPDAMTSLWKWSGILFTGHFIGTFIPSTICRVVFLGCVTDFCLLAFASPHWPSTTAYLLSLWRHVAGAS